MTDEALYERMVKDYDKALYGRLVAESNDSRRGWRLLSHNLFKSSYPYGAHKKEILAYSNWCINYAMVVRGFAEKYQPITNRLWAEMGARMREYAYERKLAPTANY